MSSDLFYEFIDIALREKDGEPGWNGSSSKLWPAGAGAGLIVFDPKKGKFLVAKRGAKSSHPGEWSTIGGNLEDNEWEPDDAAFREFVEETGFEGRQRDLDFIPLKVFYREDGFVYFNYLGITHESFEPSPSDKYADETEQFAWLSLDEVMNLPDKHPGFQEIFNHEVSLTVLKAVASRS